MWRGSCACRLGSAVEIFGSPLVPGDNGGAPDPCGPDDLVLTVEKPVCLVKDEVTHDIFCKVQTQTMCCSRLLSPHFLLPPAFCLDSCVCVFTLFPLRKNRVRDGCCDKLVAD